MINALMSFPQLNPKGPFEIDDEGIEPDVDDALEVLVTGTHIEPERVESKAEAEPLPGVVLNGQDVIGEGPAEVARVNVEPFQLAH